MRFLNIFLSAFVVVFICTSLYFLKYQAWKNKGIDEFPSFYSTKSNISNVRSGPSTTYPIKIVYKTKNMPIKVLRRYKGWLEVEDILSNRGWIKSTLLSKQRTAFVITQASKVYLQSNTNSKIIAAIDKFKIVIINKCLASRMMCKISVPLEENTKDNNKELSGWISSIDLWGANYNFIKT